MPTKAELTRELKASRRSGQRMRVDRDKNAAIIMGLHVELKDANTAHDKTRKTVGELHCQYASCLSDLQSMEEAAVRRDSDISKLEAELWTTKELVVWQVAQSKINMKSQPLTGEHHGNQG